MTVLSEDAGIIKVLRWTAILGTCLTAAGKVFSIEPLQQNQYFSFYAIGIFAAAVCIALAILPGTRGVLKNPDLLIPLGLYITANGILSVIGQASSFAGFKDGKLSFEGMTVTLMAVSILGIAVAVCFVGWTTKALLYFVEKNEVDLVRSFTDIRQWFPRTLAVLIFGSIPMFLLLALIYVPVLAGSSSWLTPAFIYPFLIFVAVFSLIWNVATAVLLPYVLSTKVSLQRAVLEGIRISWMNKLKTVFPVILLMVISGWIVFLTVQYTEHSESEADFGRSGSSSNKGTTQFSTNFIWVGDYPEETKWYPVLMKTVASKTLPAIDFRIMLLMLLLSLTVNLTIVGSVLKGEDEIPEVIGPGNGSNRGIAVFVVLLVFLIPFEYVISNSKEIINGMGSTVEAPKVYMGGNAFTKSELFKYEESTRPDDKTPIITSAGSPAGENRNESAEFPPREGWLCAVYAGEVDDEPGLDILAAGDKFAFILTPDGRMKKTVDYNLGGYMDGDRRQAYSMTYIEIADLDGDGKPEIAGHGYRLCQIRDLNGKLIWKHAKEGQEEYWSVDGLTVADIDNDGRKEILVNERNNLEVYSKDGSLKWKKNVKGFTPIAVNVTNRDGKSEINMGNFRIDGNGEVGVEVDRPFITYGYVKAENGTKYALFFDDNKLGLFDSGKLIAKYDAPRSYISAAWFMGGGERDYSNRSTSVFKAEGQYIRFGGEERKYLAVLAWASGSSLFLEMLYIYDPEGKLVYHETFDASSAGISVLPNEDGTENLLVNADGKIHKYSLN